MHNVLNTMYLVKQNTTKNNFVDIINKKNVL